MAYEQSTTRELIAEAMNSGDITERELVLIDRLQNALDEVDALEAELRGYQHAKEHAAVPERQVAKMYRTAHGIPALVVASVRNGVIAVLGALALVAGTALGSTTADQIERLLGWADDSSYMYPLDQ